jgi:hypothetical protein
MQARIDASQKKKTSYGTQGSLRVRTPLRVEKRLRPVVPLGRNRVGPLPRNRVVPFRRNPAVGMRGRIREQGRLIHHSDGVTRGTVELTHCHNSVQAWGLRLKSALYQ